MANNKTVAALIITYNRLEFLKEVINSVRNQSVKPDKIIVINNSSSDGTKEWLDTLDGLYVIEQANTGSSGGQHRGFSEFLKLSLDWLWTMDDDVVPEPDCLEQLLKLTDSHKIIAPIRIRPDGEIYLNDCIKFNFQNPFRSLWDGIIGVNDINKETIYAEGITFEGPIIHKSVIQEIGLPNKHYFIYADDSDFFIRANRAGYKTIISTKARLRRKLNPSPDTNDFSWKHYYIIRNTFALDVLYGQTGVRFLRPLYYFMIWIMRSKNLKDISTVIRAFRDGYFFKSFLKKHL